MIDKIMKLQKFLLGPTFLDLTLHTHTHTHIHIHIIIKLDSYFRRYNPRVKNTAIVKKFFCNSRVIKDRHISD